MKVCPRRWWFVLLALVAACNTGPRRSDNAVDPLVYTRCQDPEGQAAWARAQTALARGDDAAAMPDLVLATVRCPDLVRAHLARQDAARRLGGAALAAMVEFYVALPPRNSPVPDYMKARLAETPYAQSNALQAIVAKDPSFAWAHLSLARVTRRQGRLLPALEMYEAALVNDSQLFEARRERAQVLAELGREAEAAIDYKTYLAAVPDDVAALRDYVSLLLYRLTRIDEANQLLVQLEAKLPGDLSVRMDRAAALWRSKQLPESVAAYLSILEQSPTTVRAAFNIALIYYEIAPTDEAAKRRYWPRARAAFRWFLDVGGAGSDGHEQFERMLGVPFRLDRIAELIGPEPPRAVRLDDLRWPANG